MENNGRGIERVVEELEQEELKVLLKRGEDLLSKGKIEKAKQTYEKALEIARTKDIVDGELICLCYIGDILYHQARVREIDCCPPAIDYLDEASAVLKSEYGLRDLRYGHNWKSKAFRELAVKVFYCQLRSCLLCGNSYSAIEALNDLALVSFSFQKVKEILTRKLGGDQAASLIQELHIIRDSQWTSGETMDSKE